MSRQVIEGRELSQRAFATGWGNDEKRRGDEARKFVLFRRKDRYAKREAVVMLVGRLI